MVAFGFKLIYKIKPNYDSISTTSEKLNIEFLLMDTSDVILIIIYNNSKQGRVIQKCNWDYYWVDFVNKKFGFEDEEDIHIDEKRIAKSGTVFEDFRAYNKLIANSRKMTYG